MTPSPRTPSRPAAGRFPPSRLLPLLLGAVACAVYLGVELYLLDGRVGFPLDDSWIHLQFARNLAAGEGLAYNPGERVAGSTAPLWTALLSLAFLLPGSPLAWAKLLGVIAHLATVDVTWRLGRELQLSPTLSGLAAALVAATSWLVWGALSGMEIPLFTALSLWGLLLHARELRAPMRLPVSLGVLGVAALARPEGVLLLALALADRLLLPERRLGHLRLAAPHWRTVAGGAALALLVVVPVAAVYGWLAGSPLPTTFDTKAGYSAPGLPRLAFVHLVHGIFFRVQPLATLLAGAGALVLLARVGTRAHRGLLPLLWLVALPLAYGTLSARPSDPVVGNFGRYLFPLFPVVVLMGALAVEMARRWLPGRLHLGLWRLSWGAWLLLLLLLPTASALVQGAGRYAQNVMNVEDSNVRMAHWLAGRLPPEALLAVNDIGAFKYFLPNRVVDLAGIVTPEVHGHARRSIAETGAPWRGFLELLGERRPDYLVVFPSWFPLAERLPEFQPLLRLEIADNITMGGDELVLYATPWTRHPLRETESE